MSEDLPPEAPHGAETPPPGPEPVVGPRAHAVFWFAIGCAILAVAQLPLAFAAMGTHEGGSPPGVGASSSASSNTMGSGSVVEPAPSAAVDPSASVALLTGGAPPLVEPDAPPPPFRVAQLASDPTLDVVQAVVGKHGCAGTLLALGVLKRDIAHADLALKPSRPLSKCRAEDRFAVAMQKSDHALRAFEIETAPGDFVLVHPRSMAVSEPETAPDADAGVAPMVASAKPEDLVAAHYALPTTHKRSAVGFVVQTDLAAAVVESGLDASIVDLIDDAVDSRSDLSVPQHGAVVRLVADATYVLGRFDRYDELVAIEIRPSPDAQPVRLYHSKSGKGPSAWFDAKMHQPLRGKWRMPLTFARVTSRFNPKRMHPILHTIMPHNGCDFAAMPGTPVYAIAPGIVSFTGSAGPSGNLVTIIHEGGYESGYAHLSKFAPGIGSGTKVEAHTLVGYSGTTGRSTGPHLHLSVKKNGVFIDPLSLKLDGVRVVPPSDRDDFLARKADADAALDAIPLPKGPQPPPVVGVGAAPTGLPASPASPIADDDPQDD